jgi:hypothetical protein
MALALLTPALTYLPEEPAVAQAQPPLNGEAIRSDNWVEADDPVEGLEDEACQDEDDPVYTPCWNGNDLHQGYTRTNEASFWKGGRPDCLITTGRSPHAYNNSGEGAPTGLIHNAFYNQARHVIDNADPTHTGMDADNPWPMPTYYIHTAQDDEVSTQSICGRQQITLTGSTFTVTFPRTLAAVPVSVVFSVATLDSDEGDVEARAKRLNTKSTTGFTGSLWNGANPSLSMAGKTVVIDYWADTRNSVNESNYWHRAGSATITTNSSGDATINFPDFNAGNVPSAIYVMNSGGSPVPGRVVAWDLDGTQAKIRVWKHTRCIGPPTCDTRIKSSSTSVNYIAVGPKGGSPRPWNDQGGGGWTQTVADTDSNPLGLDAECGEDANGFDSCYRWDHELERVDYGYESSFEALGDIDGLDPTVYYDNAALDWSTFDTNAPTMEEVPVEVANWKVAAEDIGDQACATQQAQLTDAFYNDGLNYIFSTRTVHSTNSAIVYGSIPLTLGENCGIEGTYRHEIGHGFGLGHNEEAVSIMNTEEAHDFTTLPLDDQVSFRSMYGYSGSLYRKGLKVSDFATVGKRFGVGQVTVTGKGTPRLVNGVVHTPVNVQVSNWAGKVPATVLVPGGSLASGLTAVPSETMNIHLWDVGASFIAEVRDDGVVVEALPVQGSKVKVHHDAHAIDDVDGGNPLVVDIAKFKTKAKKVA